MPKKTLITSFATWKPKQPSNASDDLLSAVFARDRIPEHIHLLRQIPVDFQLAPARVREAIQAIAPEWVICCGMAEARTFLEIEVQAKVKEHHRCTTSDVAKLLSGLNYTQVSYDAGQFVCNHLYYSILEYLETQNSNCQCIFIHVPILTPQNQPHLIQDLQTLLQNIGA